MRFFRVVRWMVWKDLLSEIRSRENIHSMFFFALIVMLIFSFSFSVDQPSVKELLPGIIWVAFGFTGVIGLGKSFLAEIQNDNLEYLQAAPVPKGAIYLGKFLGNALFMVLVEAVLFPLFVILYNLKFTGLPEIALIFVAATIGLSALGTLFSAMTVQIRAREVMFPILLLPLAVPVFIGAVEATRGALAGEPLKFYRQWIELLVIYDIIFVTVSYWVFEFVLDY